LKKNEKVKKKGKKMKKWQKKKKKKECTMDYCYNPIHSTLGVGGQ
jgi:hypothetical protein